MLRQRKKNFLLATITLFAIALHIAALFYLHQMELNLPTFSQKGITSFCELTSQDLSDAEKDAALAELFQQLESDPIDTSEDDLNTESLDPDFVSQEITPPEITPPDLSEQLANLDPTTFSIEQIQQFDPTVDLITPDTPNGSTMDQISDFIGGDLADQLTRSTNLMQKYNTTTEGPFEAISEGQSGDPAYGMILSSARQRAAQDEASQGTIAGSSDFHLEVYFQKLKNNRGYAFQASLVPKKEVTFKRIRQNLFFIIDRSYSIDKVRYEEAKIAVSKALELLKPTDTFNILLFDKKVRRLSEKNLPVTDQTIELAIDFLANEKHGGLFSSTDLYTSLEKIIPQSVADTEVNTAILFSDGITSLNQKDQKNAIGQYTTNNNGKVSLYCVTSGKANNNALLALLAHFNKGKLIQTQTYPQQSTQVVKLLKEIRNPIGKEILVTAVTSTPANIQILPSSAKHPDLYEGIPFTILGTTDKLEDFYLFLQGKYYDKWLDIKQKVDFTQAKELSSGIDQNLAQIEAYDQYAGFLYNGDTASLREANRRLTPFNLTPVFQ